MSVRLDSLSCTVCTCVHVFASYITLFSLISQCTVNAQVDFWRLVTGKIEVHVYNMQGTLGEDEILCISLLLSTQSQTNVADQSVQMSNKQ